MLRTIATSPLLHFLILGLGIALLYQHLKPPDQEIIQVTTQTIDALVARNESISQTPLSPEQKANLIESHIDEEILLREGFKRGFDKNDYRVRTRLLGIMRSSLTDVVPEPSMAQLRAYYDENKERFRTSDSISYEFVFFQPATNNQSRDPKQFIRTLENSDAPLDLGDFSTRGNRFTKSTFQMTAGMFGKPFAEGVFKLPLNQWSGPIESFIGQHYVRVTDHHEPELPPLEATESFLRQDYLIQKTREGQQRKIDELRKGYTIIVEGVETGK